MDTTKFESTMADVQAGAQTAMETGKDVYDKAQHMAQEGYHKTSQAVSGAYESAVSYGRENPATMTLIALGIGLGVGLLLGAGLRRPRQGSFTTPIVDAVYDMVNDYLR
jgi:ElaB/YqjD/DUF883 family membrane-anchored ribosome-binding protein